MIFAYLGGMFDLPDENPFTPVAKFLIISNIIQSVLAVVLLVVIAWVWAIKQKSSKTLDKAVALLEETARNSDDAKTLLTDANSLIAEAKNLIVATKEWTHLGKEAREEVRETTKRTEHKAAVAASKAQELGEKMDQLPDKLVEKMEEVKGGSASGTSLPRPPLPPPVKKA